MFCFLLCTILPAVSSAVHFPQSGTFHQIIKPKETLYAVNFLYAGSTFKIHMDFPQPCETMIPYAILSWKIESSTCYKRFEKWTLNPLEEKLVHFIHMKTSNFAVTNRNNSLEGEKIFCGETNHLHMRNTWKSYDALDIPTKEDEFKSLSISQSELATVNATRGQLLAIAPVDGFYLVSLSLQHHNLDAQLGVTLDIKGPLGYLSKVEVPILYIHFTMQILYITILLLMLPYLFTGRHKLSHVHVLLAFLICVELIANIINSINYSRLNHSGKRDMELDIGSLIFGCLSEAMVRTTVLLLCSGLGEVSLQAVKVLVSIFLGALYFITNIVYESLWLEDSHQYTTEAFLVLTCVVEALLFFYGCKFALRTREILKNQTVSNKDGVFFTFLTLLKVCISLVASLLFIIIWSSFSAFCFLGWFLSWFRIAFWSFFHFMIIVTVAIVYKVKNRSETIMQSSFFQ